MNFKRSFIIIVKIVTAVLGIIAVFYFGKTNLADLFTQFSSIRPGFYLLSLAIVTLVIIYVTRRWQIFITANEKLVSYKNLVSINFIGCFFNLFLPSSFGGDLIRAVYLNKKITSWELSASSVFLDRFIGLLSLFFLSFLSLLIKIVLEKSDNSIVLKYLIIGSVCLFAGWILLINLHSIFRFFFKLNNNKLNKFLSKYKLFAESINLGNYPKTIILKGFMISVFGNILSGLSIFLIAMALNIQIGILPILITFPLITVISMIPLSLGGIGLREGAFVFFLAGYSVSSGSAIALSLLYFSSIIFIGIIGAAVFSFSKYTLEKIKS